MKGRIIKGIAGFYYVHIPENQQIYECKAKGIFRNQGLKPFVGDEVNIETGDISEGSGIITEIYPRKNVLTRPAVANVDQAMIMFAAAEPSPNLNLLDRFLIAMREQGLKVIVCFNKKDIVTDKEVSLLMDTYLCCGYEAISISTKTEDGITELYQSLKGRTTVIAGPSGVGKSSLINRIQPRIRMETGSVSEKIKRGKHTTRHSELIYVDKDTYVMDTPGFSSLYINEIEKEELKNYFPEFEQYEEQCRFQGCMHLNEPECAVKEALEKGKISPVRYENYKGLFQELKDLKRY